MPIHVLDLEDPTPRPPRVLRNLLLLTLLANATWAASDAMTTVVAIQDPAHPLIRPYRSGYRYGGTRLVTPTRGGVTLYTIISRGAIFIALLGWAYHIWRHRSMLAAALYGIAMATFALGMCVFDSAPSPRMEAIAPGVTWLVVRTAWMLACAALALSYAWIVREPVLSYLNVVGVSDVETIETVQTVETIQITDAPPSPDPPGPGESPAESRPPA